MSKPSLEERIEAAKDLFRMIHAQINAIDENIDELMLANSFRVIPLDDTPQNLAQAIQEINGLSAQIDEMASFCHGNPAWDDLQDLCIKYSLELSKLRRKYEGFQQDVEAKLA